MSSIRINGKQLAREWVTGLQGQATSDLYLAGFVSGEDAAGQSFQKAKKRAAKKAGITYKITTYETVTTEELKKQIADTAIDPLCGGIVVQLPLPADIDTDLILDSVPANRDPDVLGREAKERSLENKSGIISPPARVVAFLLEQQHEELANMSVAIIGMGRLIGQAITPYIEGAPKKVFLLDKGFDETVLKEADLIVLGTGQYRLDPTLLKPGTRVIDFGYQKTEEGFIGDLDTSNERNLTHLGWYTPTPGGTGPLLIAALLENFTALNSVDDTGLEPVTSSV